MSQVSYNEILIFNIYSLIVCFLPTSLPSQWSVNSHGGQYAVPAAVEVHCSSHGVGAHRRSPGCWGIW